MYNYISSLYKYVKKQCYICYCLKYNKIISRDNYKKMMLQKDIYSFNFFLEHLFDWSSTAFLEGESNEFSYATDSKDIDIRTCINSKANLKINKIVLEGLYYYSKGILALWGSTDCILLDIKFMKRKKVCKVALDMLQYPNFAKCTRSLHTEFCLVFVE